MPQKQGMEEWDRENRAGSCLNAGTKKWEHFQAVVCKAELHLFLCFSNQTEDLFQSTVDP
jgi:hypothetical protein